jgi:uridylate kinase
LTSGLAEYAEKSKKFTTRDRNSHCDSGGNIFRGVAGASNGMDESRRLYGNAATVINGMAFTRRIRRERMLTRLQTALKIEAIASHIKEELFAILKRQ